MPVRIADGQTLIRDKYKILDRWTEHYNGLLNNHTPTNHLVLRDLPQLPIQEEMDHPPTLAEVSHAIKGLRPRKAPGPDMVPSELIV